MIQTVWVVGIYCDTLKERDAKTVTREQETRKKYGYIETIPTFAAREEAVQFLIQRGKQRLAKAVDEVRKEQRRLIKLSKLAGECAGGGAPR